MPDPSPPAHGAARLAAVTVDAYNAELRSGDGFVGDRASKRAFRAILDEWRDRLRAAGHDPLGDAPDPDDRALDKLLLRGDVQSAGLVLSAVEEFAQELATVTRRFLRLHDWRGTQRIAVGGGLRASRVGELAIGRAAVLLQADGQAVELRPIRHHPDEAGLVGAVHLAPDWALDGHDCILAVDIGGTKMRVGLVELNLRRSPALAAAHVMGFVLWHHRDDGPSRDAAVERLAAMLHDMIGRAAKDGLKPAPFIGIGCPGVIRADGVIERGGQNLPGNWEDEAFNLPERIRALVPDIAGRPTTVLMHNDAVIQGLSELPGMDDVARWGVLTIGTGLGNARFSSRAQAAAAAVPGTTGR